MGDENKDLIDAESPPPAKKRLVEVDFPSEMKTPEEVVKTEEAKDSRKEVAKTEEAEDSRKEVVKTQEAEDSPEDVVKTQEAEDSPEEVAKTQEAEDSPEDVVKTQEAEESPEEVVKAQQAEESPEEVVKTQQAEESPEEVVKTQQAEESPEEVVKTQQAEESPEEVVKTQKAEESPEEVVKTQQAEESPEEVVKTQQAEESPEEVVKTQQAEESLEEVVKTQQAEELEIDKKSLDDLRESIIVLLGEEGFKSLELYDMEMQGLNFKEAQEVLKVGRKYCKLRIPFYEKRETLLKNVPDFWSNAIINHPYMEGLITVAEKIYLKYLTSFEVEDIIPIDDSTESGYRMKFLFRENPYFENDCLTKECLFVEEESWKLGKCEVDWKFQNKKIFTKFSMTFFSWLTTEGIFTEEDPTSNVLKTEIWSNPFLYYVPSPSPARPAENNDW